MNIENTIRAAASYRHRVAYADTDAGGIVYHGRYLEIAERARNAMLHDLGFNYAQLARSFGVMFVVRKVEMKFEAPAALEDTLTVATSLARCVPSHTSWLTEFFHERIGADDLGPAQRSIASVRLELVAIDTGDRKIRKHPAVLLDALQDYVASA